MLDKWAEVQHPNIVPLLGTCEVGGRPVAVTSWVKNGSLPRYLFYNPTADRKRLVRLSLTIIW